MYPYLLGTYSFLHAKCQQPNAGSRIKTSTPFTFKLWWTLEEQNWILPNKTTKNTYFTYIYSNGGQEENGPILLLIYWYTSKDLKQETAYFNIFSTSSPNIDVASAWQI